MVFDETLLDSVLTQKSSYFHQLIHDGAYVAFRICVGIWAFFCPTTRSFKTPFLFRCLEDDVYMVREHGSPEACNKEEVKYRSRQEDHIKVNQYFLFLRLNSNAGFALRELIRIPPCTLQVHSPIHVMFC